MSKYVENLPPSLSINALVDSLRKRRLYYALFPRNKDIELLALFF